MQSNIAAAEDVPTVGRLSHDPGAARWNVLDGFDRPVAACTLFLTDFAARDMAEASAKSYARALLRWFRFLWARELVWDRASRDEVRDFVLWMRSTPKPRHRPVALFIPGSVNLATGKPNLGDGYAPRTINHNLAVLSAFYEFHRSRDGRPLLNPVPSRQIADGSRVNAHHNPLQEFRLGPRADYRQKVPRSGPRAMPDKAVSAVFAKLTSHRDRALVAFYLSTAARPSELLSVRNDMIRPEDQIVTVRRKGSRALQPLPASPDAFVWLRLYQLALPDNLTAPTSPVWWTLRRPHRPLEYETMRGVLRRVNGALESNWTLHDLRHTAALRMANDSLMSLTDIQTILGHVWLSTTQQYLRPREAEVIAHAAAHFQRRSATEARAKREDPVWPETSSYDPTDMRELFGDNPW
jgi:integrase